MDATPSRHAWTGVGGMDEPDTFEERALLARMSGNPAWLDPDDDAITFDVVNDVSREETAARLRRLPPADPDDDADDDLPDTDVWVDHGDPVAAREGVVR